MSTFSMQSALLSARNVFDKLWKGISSGPALLIYAIIVFAMIVVLVVAMMTNERKTPNVVISDKKPSNMIAINAQTPVNVESAPKQVIEEEILSEIVYV